MVVCKFFLQGTCKFGDFCKFEHQLGDNYTTLQNPNSTSILRQSHFGTSQPTKPNPGNVDTNTLVKSVVNDMTVAERGGQWLLSCYAPFKEKPGFPGFEDQSFEEVRYGYYEAIKNGNLEQYKQQIQIMLQQAVLKLKSLQAPSPEIVNMLKTIYNTPPSSHAGVFGSTTITTSTPFNSSNNNPLVSQQSAFGSQSAPPIFAQANQSVFTNSAQSPNTYGATQSIFRNTTQSNIFGGQTNNSPFSNNQQQNSNKGIFNQATNNFGNQNPSSIFGGQQPGMQTNTGSIFTGGQPNSNSVFGGHQTASPFTTQAQTNSNMLSKQPNSVLGAGNVFGPQNSSTPFVQTAAPNNIFVAPPNSQANQPFGPSVMQPSINTQAQNQIFGTDPKKSIFSQQSGGPTGFVQLNQYQNSNFPLAPQTISSSDAQSHTSNIFGSSQPVKNLNLPLGHTQQIDETVYSKLEDLTEDEIKWFESDDLDIMNIPEKPPTYEMCFKK